MHSKAKLAEVTERRAKLIKLRRAGINFDDPRILALGYTSRGAATKDFARAFKKHAAEEAAEVTLYRQESKERLLDLLAAVWPAATGNGEDLDLKAHEQARKIVADLDDLLGTKAPVRTEISGPDGGDIPFSSGELSEFHALLEIAGQPDAPVPTLDHDEDGDDEDLVDDDDSDG